MTNAPSGPHGDAMELEEFVKQCLEGLRVYGHLVGRYDDAAGLAGGESQHSDLVASKTCSALSLRSLLGSVRSLPGCLGLPEGEHVRVNPAVEERDFERALGDVSGLADQLI